MNILLRPSYIVAADNRSIIFVRHYKLTSNITATILKQKRLLLPE